MQKKVCGFFVRCSTSLLTVPMARAPLLYPRNASAYLFEIRWNGKQEESSTGTQCNGVGTDKLTLLVHLSEKTAVVLVATVQHRHRVLTDTASGPSRPALHLHARIYANEEVG